MSTNFLRLFFVLIFLIWLGQGLQAQSCDCNDYLYLNDTGLNYVEKFRVENGTGSLTEIGDAMNGSPWLDAAGIVDSPHGIGADINGYLYIGERDVTSNEYNIQKFNCAGDKIDADLSTPAMDNFTDDGFGFSHFIKGEYLYVNIQTSSTGQTPEVRIYETCSGNYTGCQTLNGVSSMRLWGFTEGTDGYWYATRGTRIVRGPLDPSTFGAAGSCNEVIEEVASAASLGIPTFTNGFVQGITQDDNGILYCVYSGGFGFQPPSYIFSYNMVSGALAYSATDSNIEGDVSDNLNWAGARGIVWSPATNQLYASSAEDCIAAFDTNLNYLPASSNHVVGSYPKQIGLVTECCPNTDLTFNETVCSNGNGERIFLQDLFSCGEGIVCEGVWSETTNTSNGNIAFNDCDLSITVDGTGCATYQLQSDGSGNLNQCGAFLITVNVCTEVPDATTATNQGTCTSSTPNNDATITLSSVTNGDEAGIIAGANYTGGPAYGTGNLSVSGGSGTLTNLMHNTQYTIRVFNGTNDCFVDYTVTTPSIDCTAACSFSSAGETLESCNEAGTNSDPSDDYITFSLNPVGTSLGATYSVTADNGETVTLAAGGSATGISYGSPTAFRLQNGSADGSTNYTITITDVADGTCTVTTMVMQNSCSGTCNLTDAGETLESCNDAGTNSDASDDYITFSLNPVGGNLGASYSVSVNNGGMVTLAAGGSATGISYGSATAFRLQNGSADGSTNYTITVTDVADGTCMVTTMVMQSNCSGACNLSDSGETLESCNDAGTNSDSADDYITFSLNPVGSNLGASYSVSANNGAMVTQAAGGAATGISYGSSTAFRLQNGSADGSNNYTITVTDVAVGTCTITSMVMQNSCSDACTLTGVDASSETCNDNGTGPDATDDYISFSLNPTGINLGTSYSVTANNGGTVTLAAGGAATGVSYGSSTAFRMQDGSANGTLYNLTVTDSGDSNCTAMTSLQQTDCAVAIYSLGNRVFYDIDISGDQNGGDVGIDGITLQLLNSDGTIYDSDPNTSGTQGLMVTTANGGYYRFDDLLEGNYIVEVLASNFTSGGTLATYSSSTGTAQESTPNNDGDLNDNGLDTPVGGAIRSGIISLGGAEPTGEAEPGTYGAGSTTGTAVADTENNLTVDFGFYRQRDLPDYEDPVRPPCADEPCHFVSTDIYFGSSVTNDISSSSSSSANTDVDDGLLWGANVNAVPGNSLNLPIEIYNVTGSDAYFRIWIDWNGDGDFDDADEQVADELYLSVIYSGTFKIYQQVNIPANATTDQDLALRMRLSTDNTNSSSPCGNGNCAEDGEIEDYLLQVTCPINTCSMQSVSLTRN